MLMSIADVCEYLSVSRRTVYRYMHRRIPGACETAPGAKVAAWGY